MERILLLEDDKSLVTGLTLALGRAGYALDTARTLAEANRLWQAGRYDLLMLDVTLPDGTGFDFCREVRRTSGVPILFLTASDEEMDIITGLDLGGDDYITKPFDPVEVLARVRSQLRRYTQLGAKKVEEQANVYTVGPIVLDEEKKSVTVDGDEVALTPIEFNILRLLMKNPGRIYSSAQIYELVWKEDSLGAETSVSVHIRHLRQKLEINPSEPRYLKVVWGLGYKMEDKK